VSGVLEHLACAVGVADDETEDAELLRIGEREGEDVDLGLGERAGGRAQTPGLVLDEQ